MKKAFTLFELMIVVMIIGLVYSLVLGSFDPKKSVKIVKLETVKDALLPHWKKGIRVDLLIYDSCKKATILVNNEQKEGIKTDINTKMFKGIKVYKLDRQSQERELTFAPLLLDNRLHKVCFKFSIFPNGSSSSFIVKSGKKFYVYMPFFEPTYITTRVDDAIEFYQKKEFTKIISHE